MSTINCGFDSGEDFPEHHQTVPSKLKTLASLITLHKIAAFGPHSEIAPRSEFSSMGSCPSCYFPPPPTHVSNCLSRLSVLLSLIDTSTWPVHYLLFMRPSSHCITYYPHITTAVTLPTVLFCHLSIPVIYQTVIYQSIQHLSVDPLPIYLFIYLSNMISLSPCFSGF